MRVLMVSDDFLPNPGGIAAHVYELTRQLVTLGHRVDLIVGHDKKNVGMSPSLPGGARIVRNRPFTWNPLGYSGTTIHTALLIERLARKRQYDVCHWHNLAWESWGVRVGARALPRVFTNHSSGFPRRMRSSWRRRFQLPRLLSFADQVIAPSRARASESARIGYAKERIHCIPNGVDIEAFKPGVRDEELLARIGVRRRDKCIVVPARLEPVKGVDVLIRALPRISRAVPETKILLIGDGSERDSLIALAGKLGVRDRIAFLGNRPREEMPRHLRLGSLAVLPSRSEGLPLACLEAMATGLPVVASRVGGLPEMIDDLETGRLVDAEDPAALASTIVELLSAGKSVRRGMGRQGRRIAVDRYSWRSLAERTAEVYRRAVRGARP